jgi:hypothetical protein
LSIDGFGRKGKKKKEKQVRKGDNLSQPPSTTQAMRLKPMFRGSNESGCDPPEFPRASDRIRTGYGQELIKKHQREGK